MAASVVGVSERVKHKGGNVMRKWCFSIWRRLGPRLPWLPVDQIGRILRTAGIVVLCSVGVVMVFAIQSALYHWAPLWARLYPACVAQRPEPNTLAGIVKHRIACATFAADMIRKQW